jgi:hypothetical protein
VVSNVRKRSSGALGFGAALALFAIICGLVLIVAAPSGSKRRAEESLQQQLSGHEQVIRKELGEALKVLEAAEGSLGAANYGAARHQIARAKQRLAVILFQLDALKQTLEPHVDSN